METSSLKIVSACQRALGAASGLVICVEEGHFVCHVRCAFEPREISPKTSPEMEF